MASTGIDTMSFSVYLLPETLMGSMHVGTIILLVRLFLELWWDRRAPIPSFVLLYLFLAIVMWSTRADTIISLGDASLEIVTGSTCIDTINCSFIFFLELWLDLRWLVMCVGTSIFQVLLLWELWWDRRAQIPFLVRHALIPSQFQCQNKLITMVSTRIDPIKISRRGWTNTNWWCRRASIPSKSQGEDELTQTDGVDARQSHHDFKKRIIWKMMVPTHVNPTTATREMYTKK